MARILIIEDNPDFVAFVRAVLELNGHAVTHTASLRDGISQAQQVPQPDLVLLDLDLPDGSGLEFFNQVDTDVPVQAMTARQFADGRRACLREDIAAQFGEMSFEVGTCHGE